MRLLAKLGEQHRAHWLLIPLLLVLAIYIAMIWGKRSERFGTADEARAHFLEVCQQERPRGDCQAAAEEHHDACFRAHFAQGGQAHGTSFDRRGYLGCVEVGYPAFAKARRRQLRERQREEEQLGIPPRAAF